MDLRFSFKKNEIYKWKTIRKKQFEGRNKNNDSYNLFSKLLIFLSNKLLVSFRFDV